jgi:hypothetical protein
MPTKQQSLYPEVQFSEAGDAKIQTYGKSPSSETSSTRTLTQSYAIGARRNFYPNRPLPDEAIHSVYELKTQPKLVQYYHAAVGLPTKPSWLKAIKNKQYTLWPGLRWEAVNNHFPQSEETLKGHGHKTRSGL